jgi:hypothetical protein
LRPAHAVCIPIPPARPVVDAAGISGRPRGYVRGMAETNPQESMDAEGMPDVEDHPPGIDIELDEETMMAPREYPVASGLDPAYPVTGAEERLPESLSERAAREIPDFGAEDLDVGGGVAGGDDRRLEGGEEYVVGAFSAGTEAGAVPVEDPLAPSMDDEVALSGRDLSGAELLGTAPDASLDSDAEPDGAALPADDTDIGVSGEEAAVHVRSDDRGR